MISILPAICVILAISVVGGHAGHSAPVRSFDIFEVNLADHAHVDEGNDGEDEAGRASHDQLRAVRILYHTVLAVWRHFLPTAHAAVRFSLVQAGRWVLIIFGALLQALRYGEVE
jgi:hypothetical protein